MADGLTISATGIQGALTRLEIASNNIANLTTPGFEAARADQISLLGGGTSVSGLRFNFSRGPVELSESGFAITIQGEGFLQLDAPGGARFTRSGSFHIDASGNLVDGRGLLVSPPVQIPGGVESILVTRDGRVLAVFGDGSVSQVGLIQTFSFDNVGGLLADEGGLFAPGPSSGLPQPIPAEDVLFGMLEGSSTDLTTETLDQFLAKAAFQANTTALVIQDRTQGALLDILS